MNDIVLLDLASKNRTIFTSAYYQHDKGLKIRLLNVPDFHTLLLQIELCNVGDKKIKYTLPYLGEDVEIPEDLLTSGRNILIYLYVKGEDWGKTIFEVVLNVTRRPSR